MEGWQNSSAVLIRPFPFARCFMAEPIGFRYSGRDVPGLKETNALASRYDAAI